MYHLQEMKKCFLKLGSLSVTIFLLIINSGISVFQPQVASEVTRTIFFSGYEWNVKSSNGELWGPGPNLFNDSVQNVYVDSNGSLHLRITHEISSDQWFCAEIYSMDSFGYGTYNFTLAPGFESMNKNVVLGLFTYLDDEHEIDIEFAKWGQESADENGQFVLQPSWKPHHKNGFDFDPSGELSFHGFTWCPTIVEFRSYTDSYSFNWKFYGLGIPKSSTEHVHMNLWLMQGLAPSDYNEVEIVIEAFEFISSNCSESPINIWWIYSIFFVFSLGFVSTSIMLIIQRKKDLFKSKRTKG